MNIRLRVDSKLVTTWHSACLLRHLKLLKYYPAYDDDDDDDNDDDDDGGTFRQHRILPMPYQAAYNDDDNDDDDGDDAMTMSITTLVRKWSWLA